MVVHLGEPFFAHVLERGGGGYGEADKEDVGLRVRQGSETVIILLSGSIEETESVGLVTNPWRLSAAASPTADANANLPVACAAIPNVYTRERGRHVDMGR